MDGKKLQNQKEFYTILQDLAYILTAFVLIFMFLLRIIVVSGPSMMPTLQDGERVLLLGSVPAGKYRPGDVVVATVSTFDDTHPIIKRVIAVEGQTVDIDFALGTVTVDGQILHEPYISEPTLTDFRSGMTYPLTVPEGCVFLLGDNRNNSTDSRHQAIGCVPEDEILGKVFLRILPFSRIGAIQ